LGWKKSVSHYIGADPRQELADLVHRLVDRRGIAPRRFFIRLMSRNARIGGRRFLGTASTTRKSARTVVVSWVPKSYDMLGR
jgi:hypothetical protein